MTTDEKAQAIAEEQAAKDRELVEALQAAAAEQVDEDEETQEPFSYKGVFHAVTDMVRTVKVGLARVPANERLTEQSIIKIAELALQYYAFEYQRRAQEAARPDFSQFMTPPESGDHEGPTPDEYLRAVPDLDSTEEETDDSN